MSAASRKYFFFEKKKQKTFTRFGSTRATARNRQKFFGSFFQKRTASLLSRRNTQNTGTVGGCSGSCGFMFSS
jgi:hypothetical protein